jgi:LCP family protein required for cell wall assembly
MNNPPPPPGREYWSTRKPGPEGDGTEPPKKKRYWWRFSLASLIIVAVSAAATSSAVLLYINSIAAALGHNENVKNEVQEELLPEGAGGEPETILIMGSDKRPEFGEEFGRSDTTILLRLDPEKGIISVMSIPRDLETEIPGYGTEKFNAAYAYGGPKLTLKVVKELTGLKINHVVNIDFLGFVRAVDAIGCVYTDVDRRYYHSNVGAPPEEEYAEIDIKPGYQKLCGKKALQYVRYRHTDTDIVRSARQQNFLSQARHQISPTDLITDNHNLVDILTEYTTSDITKGTTLITLLDLLYESRNSEVNQVHFPAILSPTTVTANPEEVHHAVEEFLGEVGYDSHPHDFPEKKPEKKKAGKKGQKNGKEGKKKKKKKHHTPPGGDELVSATESGEAAGERVARHVGGGFPVFYPTRLPEGAFYQEDNPYEHIVNPYVYHLKDKDKVRHGAYRMVLEYQPEYEVNYFGVQGIQGWEDPPILDSPTETKTVNGREYSIYTDSGKIKLVAWHRGENSYWISNSLQQSLTNEQMMGIAESCHVILPKKKTAKKGSKTE